MRLSEKSKRVPRSWISEGPKRPNKAFWVRPWRLTGLAWASFTNFHTVSEGKFSEVRVYGVLRTPHNPGPAPMSVWGSDRLTRGAESYVLSDKPGHGEYLRSIRRYP